MSAVGTVGLGAMGTPMALALREAGADVVVHDVSPTAADHARAAGLAVAEDLQSLARGCDVVVLSLPIPPVVESVVRQLLEADDRLTILDTSTNGPDTARQMHSLTSGLPGSYADCPVLGRPERVGRWTIPVGGDEATFRTASTVLAPLAERVVHVGDAGAAAAIKVLNNLMLGAINAITAEVLVLAEASGVDPGVFVDVVIDSGAASVSGLFKDVAPRAVDGRFEPTFSLKLMHKDNALALQMADAAAIPMVVGRAAQAVNELGLAAGCGDDDSIAVIKALERTTGHVARRHPAVPGRPTAAATEDANVRPES